MPKVDKRKKIEWTVDNLELRTIQQDYNGETVNQPVIAGYAAVYNSESDLLYGFFREVIKPGAFDGSLGNDIRCLWNHNAAYVLGRTTAGTLDVRSDAKGLYFEVQPPNATWANDLCESVRRKDINQMSFGFTVNEDNWESLEDGSEMRELLDVDLFEVSVVTFPAYQATSAGMRSLDQEDEEVQKRIEERKKEKQGEKPMDLKRYTDYLKMISKRAKQDPDGDPDYKSPEEDEDERAKAVDDADGGEPLDSGSEADDPNDNDTTDDDEGDEDGSDDEKRSDLDPDDEQADDPFETCEDCGTIQGADSLCENCGLCNDCCTC